jgi:hypothetical protein
LSVGGRYPPEEQDVDAGITFTLATAFAGGAIRTRAPEERHAQP